MGFRVSGVGFRIRTCQRSVPQAVKQGLGFRVWGLGWHLETMLNGGHFGYLFSLPVDPLRSIVLGFFPKGSRKGCMEHLGIRVASNPIRVQVCIHVCISSKFRRNCSKHEIGCANNDMKRSIKDTRRLTSIVLICMKHIWTLSCLLV